MEETSNSNELHVLNGLIHRETYSVSVEAVNRVGTGPASPSIEFTMIQGGESKSTYLASAFYTEIYDFHEKNYLFTTILCRVRCNNGSVTSLLLQQTFKTFKNKYLAKYLRGSLCRFR